METLNLIQQLNDKMDEIFNSLASCLEAYDSNQTTKLAKLESDIPRIDEKLAEEFKRIDDRFEEFVKTMEADKAKFTEELKTKSNRASVATALHRKANKKDFEEKQAQVSEQMEKIEEATKTKQEEVNTMLVKTGEKLAEKVHQLDAAICSKIGDLNKDINDRIMKSATGTEASIFDKMQAQINKFFKNYALEQFGTSVLQLEENVELKVILEQVVDYQLKKHKMESNVHKNSVMMDVQNEIMDQVNSEVEELQLQINALRSTLKSVQKKKSLMESPSADFSFEQENGEFGQKPSIHGVHQELSVMKTDIEKLGRSLNQKSGIKDVCALIETKANTADVFKVFDEIKKTVDLISSKQQSLEQSKSFGEILSEQKLLNYGINSFNNSLLQGLDA